MTTHRIYIGDSREVLKQIEPESVALCVTSPPYFVGREYESYLQTEDEFWDLIIRVFGRVQKVLEPFGKVAINFADRYANSKFGKPGEVLYAGMYDTFMKELGFTLWARIIWDKSRVYLDGALHLQGKSNKTGQMRVSPNWEYIFVWRKDSPGSPPVKQVDMSDEERIAWTDAVWTISSVNRNDKLGKYKLAKFPEEIPYRLIKMYTQPGDVVLDPFAGSFTTTKVAASLGRNSISVEINPVMLDLLERDMFNEYIIFS